MGCGAGGFGVSSSTRAVQGVVGGQGELSMLMCVHVSVFMCVHTCTCMALPFPQSFGEGGNAALGMLHQDEAFGWLLVHGPGSGAPGTPCAKPSSKPAPQHRTCHCAHVPPRGRVSPFVSNLLSLPIHCFELYTLKKQPQSIVCTGWRLWELALESSAEDSHCLPRGESSPFDFKTADSNTMQYVLVFVSGRCA